MEDSVALITYSCCITLIKHWWKKKIKPTRDASQKVLLVPIIVNVMPVEPTEISFFSFHANHFFNASLRLTIVED